VVLTDELFRDALTPDRALAAFAALPADAVVHVVVPELQAAGLELPDEPGLALTDAYDDQFAALATRHHGIHVALNVPAPAGAEVGRVAAPTGALAGKLAVAVLELVRPIKIEEVSVTGLTTEVAGTLREGEGVRLVDSTGSPPFAITLRGRLWSDPIHVELSPLTGFSQQTAAFLAGAGHLDELSPDEQFAVARYAGAVSPVTSYLAIEPGTRPSPLGLERGGYGTVGYGSGGGGLGYGLGSGDHGLILPRPDPGALIDTAPCVAQLRPQDYWRADLTLQTTKDEIVDVIVDGGGAGGATGPSGPSGPSALTRCLVEQAWATHLDPSWFTQSREDFHVALGSEISHPTVWHR
ncbi:MAG TPA: hypothetical protein VH165_03060, partial [Kofleriaceae bacterium]|nr:hypothetical protein [Kofleriaceae bacterium]